MGEETIEAASGHDARKYTPCILRTIKMDSGFRAARIAGNNAILIYTAFSADWTAGARGLILTGFSEGPTDAERH
jgi:hypothetical protein